jgi:hypothetical protein
MWVDVEKDENQAKNIYSSVKRFLRYMWPNLFDVHEEAAQSSVHLQYRYGCCR